jgi:hypothetical protein
MSQAAAAGALPSAPPRREEPATPGALASAPPPREEPRTRRAKLAAPLAVGLVASLSFGLVCCMVARASERRPSQLTGFISAPTDEVAVPGYAPSGELTPEGDLYTGWAEYELRIGPHLSPWDQPTRTLPDPSLPLYRSVLDSDGVRYVETVFAVPLAGMPVAYETIEAANPTRRHRTARVEMAVAYTKGATILTPEGSTAAYRYPRPAEGGLLGSYTQPGQAFSEAFEYTASGRDLDRSGLVLARGPNARSSELAPPPPASPSTAEDAAQDARLFTARLAPRRHVSFTWQIPLAPPAVESIEQRELEAGSRTSAVQELQAGWLQAERGLAQIEVPEPRVDAAYRAAIVQVLDSRIQTADGWMQTPNHLEYQAYWIRDAAIETNALDLVGLRLPAEQNIAFFDAFQREDGLFISQEGQYDELGQALWAIGRHAQLTGSRSFAEAELPRVAAAVGWLASASAADSLGLLPPAQPKDNELVEGHITGDDLWAADGLRASVALARIAGQEALAAEWQQLDERFEASLRAAIAAAFAVTGHIPPALDAAGGEDWGNYNASYPEEIIPPRAPEVSATLAWAREHSLDGLPTYADGEELHGYLGFRLFETELEAGERAAAVAGLYDELVHTTSTYGGWELLSADLGERSSGSDLEPHATFAAEYVALLRNMLLRESSSGKIDLLSGASPAWLRRRQHITVSDAPTADGPLSFEERSNRAGESLHWTASAAAAAKLVWALPPWARAPRLPDGRRVGRSILLRGDSGTLVVRFRGRRPTQSYARTVAALDSYYRGNGQPPPIVRARTHVPE